MRSTHDFKMDKRKNIHLCLHRKYKIEKHEKHQDYLLITNTFNLTSDLCFLQYFYSIVLSLLYLNIYTD